MDNFSALLSKYRKSSDIGSKVTKEIFFTKFLDIIKELFNEDIIKYVKPVYVKNNNLKIICHNSVIASMIKLKENIILEKIKELHTEFNIEKILIETNSSF